MGLNIGGALGGALGGFASGGGWGALAGGLAGAFSGSPTSPAAYQQAAAGAQFNPYNVSNSFGTGVFDREAGTAGFNLNPEMQRLQDMFGQQATQFAGQGQTQAGALASQGGLDFLNQGINADPNAVAQQQFGQIQDFLAPSRENQRQALESRLLKQGRLGSTGGALSEQAQQDSFGQQDLQALIQSMQMGQDVQGNQLRRGGALTALGNQQGQLGFANAQDRLNAIQGIDRQGMDALRLGGTFGGSQANAGFNAGSLAARGAGITDKINAGTQAGIFGNLGALRGVFGGSSDEGSVQDSVFSSQPYQESIFRQQAQKPTGLGSEFNFV